MHVNSVEHLSRNKCGKINIIIVSLYFANIRYSETNISFGLPSDITCMSDHYQLWSDTIVKL